MKRTCSHCGTPIKETKIVAHSVAGVAGTYCSANCYMSAANSKPTLTVRQRHDDAETLMPVERIR